jgi:hypothetical protein
LPKLVAAGRLLVHRTKSTKFWQLKIEQHAIYHPKWQFVNTHPQDRLHGRKKLAKNVRSKKNKKHTLPTYPIILEWKIKFSWLIYHFIS